MASDADAALQRLFHEGTVGPDADGEAASRDAWHPELKGGTGHSFDWSSFPQLDIPLILAGGLNPDNIEEAIKQIRPYGVDVATGVEARPGKKDASKMQKFIDIAKSFDKKREEIENGNTHDGADETEPFSAIYDWADEGQ